MGEVICPNCKIKLRIEDNDYIAGCREMVECYCPKCGEEVDKVFTSGKPRVYIVNEDK